MIGQILKVAYLHKDGVVTSTVNPNITLQKKLIHLIKTYDWFYVQYLPSQVQLDAFPNVKPSFFTRIRPFFLRSQLF